MLQDKTIGFIGGGQMCQAILCGILADGMIQPQKILITDRHQDRLDMLSTQYDVRTAFNDAHNHGINQISRECNLVIFAIKPQHARELLMQISTMFSPKQLIISIMGGITLDFLSEFLPNNPILRVMPNISMRIRKGIAGIAANKNAAKEDCDMAIALFKLVGAAYLLPENLIDPLTSISGCGPAFASVFMEALADGGVAGGLSREMALELSAQALCGAAEMVLQTQIHPAQLKDSVCSPAGSTIAGIHALEQGNFRAAVMNAVAESCRRMSELGRKA